MANILKDLKNNKKQAAVLAAVVSLLMLILYGNFLLMPHISWLGGVTQKVGKVKSELKNAEADIGKIDNLKKTLEVNKEKITRYEETLPAEQEIPALLENLSNIARNSNVKIVAITPVDFRQEKQQKDRIYREIPILINAKSGFHELGSFISKLESSDRFMKVVDMEIRANKNSARVHDIELLVLTYTLLGGR